MQRLMLVSSFLFVGASAETVAIVQSDDVAADALAALLLGINPSFVSTEIQYRRATPLMQKKTPGAVGPGTEEKEEEKKGVQHKNKKGEYGRMKKRVEQAKSLAEIADVEAFAKNPLMSGASMRKNLIQAAKRKFKDELPKGWGAVYSPKRQARYAIYQAMGEKDLKALEKALAAAEELEIEGAIIEKATALKDEMSGDAAPAEEVAA